MTEKLIQPDLRHFLIIRDLIEDEGQDGFYEEREWEIEHDPLCIPYYDSEGRFASHYTCGVGEEILNIGLDSLEPDWETLESGRYEIQLWSSYSEITREYDGGLTLVHEQV